MVSGLCRVTQGEEWPRYFWERGHDLAPCHVVLPAGPYLQDIPENYLVAVARANGDYFRESHIFFERELSRKPPALYRPETDEILAGLIARAYRLCVQMISFPPNQTDDMADVLLRMVVETYITARWLIEKGKDADFTRLLEHAAGTDKLYAEHVRVLMERQGAGRDAIETEVNRIINSGMSRNPDLTPVELGHWSGKDIRRLALEVGCGDIYNLLYTPCSWTAHGAFCAVARQNMALCIEPLHGRHRVPLYWRKPPVTKWGYENALLLMDDLWTRWVSWRGGPTDSSTPLPGSRHLQRLGELSHMEPKVHRPASADEAQGRNPREEPGTVTLFREASGHLGRFRPPI
jgi:hypothetical protein